MPTAILSLRARLRLLEAENRRLKEVNVRWEAALRDIVASPVDDHWCNIHKGLSICYDGRIGDPYYVAKDALDAGVR